MIQVTRHGDVIAVLLPRSGTLGRYTSLVARGIVRLKATTTSDLDRVPQYAVPADAPALKTLLAERVDDPR
jgi:hypothetical protein